MRKIVFSVVVIAFILSGCVDTRCDDDIYTMFNQTDKNVKVIGFNIDEDLSTNTIAITANTHFQVNRGCGQDAEAGSFYSFSSVDSVRVIFNNQRVKVYTHESVYDTPDSSIFDGDYNLSHFITEEDYNNAIDCNGDCE